MTGFRLEKGKFTSDQIDKWSALDPRLRNWPVVYVLNNDREVYVGESLNVESRMHQHLDSVEKQRLEWVRVVLDQRFNKSACLDLESFLIRMFSGDGHLQVLNRNAGITNADYYDRGAYRETFEEVFEAFRVNEHLFQRTLPSIINSDLFKLSPFKALNHDQAIAVEDILEGLFSDLESGDQSEIVVQGNPGTGKTVVAIYLMKLLEDIRNHNVEEPFDSDSIFSDFFAPGHAELLSSLKMGIVVPQQSLRESISKVFKLTPGMNKNSVLTPFKVGFSEEKFDLIIVDEAHRLTQRANQSAGPLNKQFAEINQKLFGEDSMELTQLDWLREQTKHLILMLDTGQSVRPADLPSQVTEQVLAKASKDHRLYPLESQMRISADEDYVGYIRSILSDKPPAASQSFAEYDLQFFDDLDLMRQEIARREEEHGLSRLVAGYAWPWRSKKDKNAFDIEVDGAHLRWNSAERDWISSRHSSDEVGSIHTVQGYDLNYAGVIIGNDLRYDSSNHKITFDRAEYHDKKGKEDNLKRGINYSDHDLLQYVRNIYGVLLTRGIIGTYVYVCDPALREYLRRYL
ncbi:MAG: DNA/RNA helicase domain-containing protein [Ancrocorticia sp.]|uniref:DNA/RNA helicase domain-containing protein n=2 Tax=Ancrocorticia sp. TaxID=2593684 RepID=UPI003F8DFA09